VERETSPCSRGPNHEAIAGIALHSVPSQSKTGNLGLLARTTARIPERSSGIFNLRACQAFLNLLKCFQFYFRPNGAVLHVNV